MLPSMRQFLRFVDLEAEFVNYGFYQKVRTRYKFIYLLCSDSLKDWRRLSVGARQTRRMYA